MWVLERGLIFSSLRLGSIALDFSKHVASLSLFNAAAQARFFFLFPFFSLKHVASLSLFNAAAQAHLYNLLFKSASLRARGFRRR